MRFNLLTEAPTGKTLNLRRNGFVIAPEENFSDDGNHFICYWYDPEHKGDKRFRTSKLISDGYAYISVRYYNEETGHYKYFDDLNGVDYQYAIDHIKDLTDKIDAFKADLDAGKFDVIELSDDQIKAVEEETEKIHASENNFLSASMNKAFEKMGINPDRIKSDIKSNILKRVEAKERNAKEDNPVLVKVLAKACLENTMKAIKGTEGHYGPRSKWTSGQKPISLDDALRRNVDVDTFSWSPEAEELIDAGLEPSKTYWLNDLTDASQDRIRDWVRKKIETLYDFE